MRGEEKVINMNPNASQQQEPSSNEKRQMLKAYKMALKESVELKKLQVEDIELEIQFYHANKEYEAIQKQIKKEKEEKEKELREKAEFVKPEPREKIEIVKG